MYESFGDTAVDRDVGTQAELAELTHFDLFKIFAIIIVSMLPIPVFLIILIYCYMSANNMVGRPLVSFMAIGGHTIPLFWIWIASVVSTHRLVNGHKGVACVFVGVIVGMISIASALVFLVLGQMEAMRFAD